jgi:hypothetical protein
MKGESEQPRFASRFNARRDVQEEFRRGRKRVVGEYPHPSALLDDEPASGIVRRLDHCDRLLEWRERREHPLEPQ